MIVVVGSDHDPVARELVAAWPQAALCSASDIVKRGWSWSPTGAVENRWVIDGKIVDDTAISGVFVRRGAFYPEEFTGTHPDDRAYLASEAHAFLADVLASTSARVSVPAADGTFGDELLPPSRWMSSAIDCGLVVAPLKLRSKAPSNAPRKSVRRIEIVGGVAIRHRSQRIPAGLAALSRSLGLRWAVAILDARDRIVTVTTFAVPSVAARAALGRLFASEGLTP